MILKIYLKDDFKIGAESTPYLKPENSPGPLTEHSTGTLVVLLDYLASSLYFTWVNPTNRKFEERALYRAAELDETGRYAYKATIFPIMTVGLARQDSAFSMVNFREGEKLSPYIKIPVDRSIYPEQTEIPPTAVDDINAEINGIKQDVHEIEVYLPGLENLVQYSIRNVTYTPSNGYLTFNRVNGTSFSLDLPLELIVKSGYYDDENKQLVLVLANNDEINIPVGDILAGIATQDYVQEQITARQAITKVEHSPFDEVGVITFMESVENGIYKIKTQLWGDELLFVSDMFLPDKEIVWGEDEEPTLVLYKEYARYTSNGSSFKYNGNVEEWEMSAGGGGGGGAGASVFKLTSLSPLTSAIAVGDELKVSVRFQHSLVQFGTMRVLRGSGVIENRGVQTGDILVDLTSHIRAGSNTFTIEISDGETIRTISYNVTGVAINLTSTFNDIQSYGSDVSIPYRVETAAERKVYFTVDGITETITEVQLNNIKTLTGLTHGVKEVEIQAAALINGVEILSNKLHFNLIIAINDTPPLISSKFDISTASRGSLVSVDYIIYNPLLEFNEVLLKIDGVLVGQTTVGRARQFWNLRNLEEGVRILRIESAGVFVEKTITITPLEINFENVQDSFLKLYLNSSGRTNSDANKTQWFNSYGPALTTNLVGFNFASNGWIDDSLVLNGNSKVIVPYKPFQTPVQAVGRTIEIEFETTVGLTDEFIKCMHNNRGFIIYKDRAFLRSSNTSSEVFFQENEKIKLSFVISPVDGTTKVYVNGVMTGIDRMNIETNFQQSVAQDIIINEKYVDGKVFNIRVYERALDHQEILQNYLYDLVSIEDKIEEYTFSDVYDANGMPDIEKVKSRMPVMVIRTYTSDEFGNKLPQTENFRPFVTANYEHNSDPSKNFTLPNVRIRTQGTSTLQYPVKNYRLYEGDLETTPVLLNDEMHPAVRINLKADYMESSMSTDPALALLFNTVHTKPIPPKAIDGVSRTTIWTEGAVALFHDDGLSLRFEGVYSLNGDKGDNKQWGFYPELPFPESDMRRFEILFNAANHAVSFVKNPLLSEQEWMTQLYEGFEPRYPYDSEGDEIYTPEQYAQLSDFIEFISDADLDTPEGIAAFKAEFEQRAELEYFIKFLLTIFIFGLVDNFGKDLLLNTWGNEGGLYPKWYVVLYDMDSGIGIDNQGFMTDSEGNLLFDYNIEMEDENVFAQASSKLWDAIVIAYPETLKSTYASLRSSVYTWGNIWKHIYTDQIATISKAMYNSNAIAKYIEIPGSASWLWMLNGDRVNQMKRWITNRLAYLDSKYDYNTDEKSITARFDIADTEWFNIQVKTSLHQWATAQLGNSTAGYMKTRTQLGEAATLNHTYANGTELPFVEFELFNGQHIKELINMKNLPVRTLQIDQAEALEILDLSKVSPNSQLQSVSFGNNKELLEINLRNNNGLSGLIDLSQANKLRKIDIRDTVLTSALLPEGGVLTELRLPSTISSLRLVNQTYLTDELFEIQGTPEFDSLRIENSPGVDSIDLIQYLAPTGAVRITNIELVTNKTSFLDDLVDMLEGRQGIDSFGNIVPNPVLTGTITIYAGSNFDKSYYQSKLPNIIFNHVILPEGLTYTFSGGNAQISGYTGNAATLVIPESVPEGLDAVDYVLGSNVQIRPVNVLGGTNTFGSTMQNLFVPSTVIATSGTPLASGFAGRIMTSHLEKPAGWNISYENILYNERPFIQEEDFFVRIYNNNTEIELLTMVGSNIKLVTVPRSVEGLTITTIPANTILGTPTSIYIPNSITSVSASLSTVSFVLTESSELDGYVTGSNVTWNVSDSLKTYTIICNNLDDSTDTYTQTWYAFLGIESLIGNLYYVNEIEIDIPYVSIGNTSIDTYEIPDYRTFSYNGTSYTLDSVIIDVSEPVGSYILLIPDEYDDGINGLKPCNPSSTLFTDTNFPLVSREKIKEIYYYSNVTSTATIPGFNNSTSHSLTTLGFLGNNNFPYREKLALYTKKTTLNGMRDGDMTEVHFVNGFSTNAFQAVNTPGLGLAENKLKNVDSILVGVLAESNIYTLGGGGTANMSIFRWNEIETLEIPYGYTSIGKDIFYDNQLTSLTIPNSVTSIGDNAFRNNQLTSLTIPNSVTSIGNYAFQYNPLTSLTLPDNITSISDFTFQYNQLTSITIPSSVTSIGNYAFYNTVPTSVTIYATTPPTAGFSIFGAESNTTCYVPAGSGAAYQAADKWSSMTIIEMT